MLGTTRATITARTFVQRNSPDGTALTKKSAGRIKQITGFVVAPRMVNILEISSTSTAGATAQTSIPRLRM